MQPILPASLTRVLVFVAALVGTLLVGSVRLTPVQAGEQPGLMLGPLTDDPAFENRGTIAALVSRALTRLRRLRRWWSYRPERRYMRDSGHVAR